MNRHFDPHEFQLNINRRTFLGQAAYGLGGLALACLIDPKLLRAADSLSNHASRSETVRLRGYAEEAARLLSRAGESVEAARLLVRELGGGPPAGATTLRRCTARRRRSTARSPRTASA